MAEANAFRRFCYSPRPLLYPCRDQSAVSHSLAARIALTFVCRLRCALTELHLLRERQFCTCASRSSVPLSKAWAIARAWISWGQRQLHLLVPQRLSSPKVRPLPQPIAHPPSPLTALLHLRLHRHPRRHLRDHHRRRRVSAPPSSPLVSPLPLYRRNITVTPPSSPSPPPSPPICFRLARCLCHGRLSVVAPMAASRGFAHVAAI